MKNGDAEHDAELGSCCRADADGDVHQDAAEDGADERAEEGLVDLCRADGGGRAPIEVDGGAEDENAADDRRDRVAEQTRKSAESVSFLWSAMIRPMRPV
jgi:hypothetical protein